MKIHNVHKELEYSPTNNDHLPHYAETDYRKGKVDQLILNLIITDKQPCSIVNGKGFNELISYLDSKYQLPSTKTLKKLLCEKYEEKKTIRKTEL